MNAPFHKGPHQIEVLTAADEPKHDTAAAVDFLCGMPGFPVLTAVHVDPKTQQKTRVETKSFPHPVDRKALHDWIEARQGLANIYYALNPLMRPMDKKAERTDVKEVAALHVDLDPRQGESQEEAFVRIKGRLEKYEPRPSLVIASGGGLQAIWMLEEPIPLDGTVETADDAKRYNFALERSLDGDACHNIDRILRVPFTWNVPDIRKIKKGRVKALASVLWWEDRKYPIGKFQKAVQVAASGGAARASVIDVKVPGNIERFSNIADDKRLAEVKGWVKVVIMYGKDPDGIRVWKSRSDAVMAVCCELVRAGLSDEEIYAIITDPDLGVSESIRDKKNSEREATRVIGRSRERAIDPDLADMNQEHAVVPIGGKTRVLSWEESPIYPGRFVPIFSPLDDFVNLHMNRRKEIVVEGEVKRIPMGKWWVGHPQRKQYKGIGFFPFSDADTVGGRLNMWTGFAVAAAKGDCSLLLDHVRENVCGGDQIVYDYLINWMARSVQDRNGPGEVAIVMRGRRGTGKSFLARTWGSLFGQHFLHVANPEHLIGRFNAHLQECYALFADECFFAGDRRHEGILKTLITERTLTIEPKGVNSFQVRNFIHMMMASNEKFVVPAGEDERRFLVLDVAAGRIQDGAYFGAIQDQLDNGGLAAFLHFLMAIDISNFDVRKVPQTNALDDQKRLARHGIDALVEAVAHRGMLPFAHHKTPDAAITSGDERGKGFWQWARDNFQELRFWSPHAMAAELNKRWGCKPWRTHGMRGLRFPPLAELRAEFDKRHGPQEWEHPDDDWELPDTTLSPGGREEQVPQGDIPF